MTASIWKPNGFSPEVVPIKTFEFSATAGQTTFSITPYTVIYKAQVQVFRGGSSAIRGLIVKNSEFSIVGTNVVLTTAALIGEYIRVEVYVELPTQGQNIIPPLVPGKFLFTDGADLSWEDAATNVVTPEQFGALGNNVADDTAAFQAAYDYLYANGGGIIQCGPKNYKLTSVVKVWTAPVSVALRGSGARSTYLRKFDSSTTPLLDLRCTLGVLESYSSISDLAIIGNAKTHHGISLTLFARFTLRRLFIQLCNFGVSAEGALVFSVYDCTFQANNRGYRSVKSGAVRANLVQFFGGQFSGNSQYGMDLGDCNGVRLYGVDLEQNGSTGDVLSGAIVLRSNIDDETGYANFAAHGCWFESNLGQTFRAEPAIGLSISIYDAICLGNEGGRVFATGAVGFVGVYNVNSGSNNDTWEINAGRSYIVNSTLFTVSDSSTKRTYINLATSSGPVYDHYEKNNGFRMGFTSADLLIGESQQVSGGATDSVDYYLYNPSATHNFWVNGTKPLQLGSNKVGFYGTNALPKPTVTGAKAGNVALASLITQLAALGLITDSTT